MANRFGALRITAVKAKGLPNVQTFGTQDPYIKMKLNTQDGDKGYQRSATHEDGGKNPEWGHEFILKTLEGNERYVSIQIWNEETVSDDRISWLDLDVQEACEQGTGDKPAKWYTMNKKSGTPGDMKGGDLLLLIRFFPGPNDPATKARLAAEAKAKAAAEEEARQRAEAEAKAKAEQEERERQEQERKAEEAAAERAQEEAAAALAAAHAMAEEERKKAQEAANAAREALERMRAQAEQARREAEEAARKAAEEAAARRAAEEAARQAEQQRQEAEATRIRILAEQEAARLAAEAAEAKAAEERRQREEEKKRSEESEMKGLPDFSIVGLHCCSSKFFVTATPDHQAKATVTHLQAWERFQLQRLPDKHIAFKSRFGRFLSCAGDKLALAEDLGNNEKFSVQCLSDDLDGLVALKGANGKFLNAELTFGSEDIGDNAKWFLVAVLPEIMYLKTFQGKLLSTQPSGMLEGNRNEVGAWEKFSVRQANRHGVSLQGWSGSGKYLSAQPDGRVEINRPALGAWEWFEMSYKGLNRISLKGCHGKYLTVTDGMQPMCNAEVADDHATFQFGKA